MPFLFTCSTCRKLLARCKKESNFMISGTISQEDLCIFHKKYIFGLWQLTVLCKIGQHLFKSPFLSIFVSILGWMGVNLFSSRDNAFEKNQAKYSVKFLTFSPDTWDNLNLLYCDIVIKRSWNFPISAARSGYNRSLIPPPCWWYRNSNETNNRGPLPHKAWHERDPTKAKKMPILQMLRVGC